jgi:hypothetical protein
LVEADLSFCRLHVRLMGRGDKRRAEKYGVGGTDLGDAAGGAAGANAGAAAGLRALSPTLSRCEEPRRPIEQR